MTTDQNLIENLGYRAHPFIANSDLRYLHSPKLFMLNKSRKLEEETTTYYSTGTLIDRFLLDSPEEFNKHYIKKQEVDAPTSAQQKGFIEDVMQESTPDDLFQEEISDELLEEIHGKYYKKPSLTAAKAMYIQFLPYMKFIISSEGKDTYTEKEMDMLITIKNNCIRNPQINRILFNPKSTDIQLKHLQIIGMKKWEINWKGELDVCLIDPIDKIIFNVDIKSSSKKITSFPYFYNAYNYDRQQALYYLLLKYHLVKTGIVHADDIDSYIFKHRCIVVGTTELNEVHFVPVPYEMINKGIEKLEEASRTLNYHFKNGWENTRSFMENDGTEILDWDEFL